MGWIAEIAALRRAVKLDIEKAINGFTGWTLTSRTSSMGDEDAVELADSTDGQRPVQRMEQYGFRSRPVGKLRGLWLKLGSSNVAFIGIMPSKAYGPTDLDEGESAVYNTTAALLRLFKTGKVTLDSDNEDVVVNGGTLQVARKTDKVIADTTMTTWLSKANAILSLIDVSMVLPTDFGVINQGAAKFKA